MSYLYYILYSHLRKVKTNTTPAFNAMLMISTAQVMNIWAIIVVINHLNIININFISKDQLVATSITLGLTLYAINFFYLCQRRGEICKRYGENGEGVSKIGVLVLVTYLIGSFIMLYLVGSRFPFQVHSNK